jgi:ABC-type amino acid transport substrate-binding protein/mono/diheme cytochrome c family protein
LSTVAATTQTVVDLLQQRQQRELNMRAIRSRIGTGSRSKRLALARSRMVGVAIASTLAAMSTQAAAEDASPLRLCADPTNLPFSSDSPPEPGFYLEIGEALGQALGRPVTYDWYKSYFGKRTVRVTLLGRQCDAMIGLPLSDDFMGPAVIFSEKITTEAYALVTASNQNISGINDLKGKRVAVQYETTPQNLLAQRDDIEKITVLTPDEGMKALEQGKADVAFIWGPVAGWLNKTSYANHYRIQPVEGSGMSWNVAIGFAKGSGSLRDQVNAALPRLEHTIADLAVKYGLPTAQPIQLNAAEVHSKSAALEAAFQPQPAAAPVQASNVSETVGQAATTATAPATAVPKPEEISAGKEIFNGTCAHCHGPDAVQSERRIDLRLLQNRYGEDMRSKFWTTVHEGRPAKGMPSWKEVFTDDQFESIYTFLLTVQSPVDPTD